MYDDSEKLIDSRFLKNDEVIGSGGTLTFEAHLVDIGSLEEKGPFKNLNSSRNDSKLSEKAQNLQQKGTYIQLLTSFYLRYVNFTSLLRICNRRVLTFNLLFIFNM